MNPRALEVEPGQDYKLKVTFMNGEVRTADMTPYLQHGIFSELQDQAYFQRAIVESGIVTWPHGQDI